MTQPNPCQESIVGPLLRRQGATVATAESCTGGLIGHLLTNVSGSSDYVLGGVIAYADEIKERVLGVRAETLAAHGAVSRETALEMARGARRLLGADYALAVTGIAGPGGGSVDKPVGLVYIALAGPGVERCERHVWEGDRRDNKERSARRALQMLVEVLRDAPGAQDAARPEEVPGGR
jgi:PncC family amidohydrolase